MYEEVLGGLKFRTVLCSPLFCLFQHSLQYFHILVICSPIGTGSRYVVLLVLLRSAASGGEKNVAANSVAFSSFDVALLIVGMWYGVGIESIYFFTIQIFLLSASSMNSLHVLCFALFAS